MKLKVWLKRVLREFLQIEGTGVGRVRVPEIGAHWFLVDAQHLDSLALGNLTTRVTQLEGELRKLRGLK